jgi:hypothetical protein
MTRDYGVVTSSLLIVLFTFEFFINILLEILSFENVIQF